MLWLLTCFTLTALGIIFKSPGPEYHGGIYYILYGLFILLLSIIFHKNGKLETFELPISVFILGVVTILFSEPLYENDHYRYLWEGNAFFRGENPYLNSPDSKALEHLVYPGKERIGFAHLSTVYPPLGIAWFGLGGVFGWEVGLRILMLFNACLVYFSLGKLKELTKPWMLVALLPVFAKEFIQAIHIDLLAAFFFLLLLTESKNDFRKKLIFVFLSIWTKVLGIAALPFLLFQNTKDFKSISKRIMPIFILGISLPLFLEWYVGLKHLVGVKQFTIDWVWNPGFYSLLTRALNLFDDEARRLTGMAFAVYISILALICLWELQKKNWNLSKDFSLRMYYLIFSGLMFFTPVYNGWYAIWFIFPALILKLNSGVIYGVISVFCYMHYGLEEFHWLGELLTHVWFPISVFELLRRRRLN